MRAFLATMLLLLAACGSTWAQAVQRPVLPGIGGVENRERVRTDAPPWRALGRLQANAGNLHVTCTAALIGPKLLLTAAHCLYNPRTQNFFRPADLHFLLGYAQGQFAAHARGVTLILGTGYDPRRRDGSIIGSDWAMIAIDLPLGTADRRLEIADQPPQAGRPALLGGYNQDYAELIMADTHCRIIGSANDRAGQRYIRHDCAATRGASGAPLLVREGNAWRIVGITVGAGRDEIGGVAASALPARARLMGQN